MQYNLFLKTLTNIFPLDSALEGDKVGLQIKVNIKKVEKVLVAYELNAEVIEEAINKQVEMIIVFHPLIYRPLQEIDYEERVSNLTAKLIKNDISLYSLHTCFDNNKEGTNSILADRFDLKNRTWLVPDKKYPENGFGIIGELNKKLEISSFIDKCSEIFMSPIRYNPNGKSKFVKKVAIIGGSGTSHLSQVEMADVDAFITADVSYHNFHRVEGKMFLIDPGHYEMEQFIAKSLHGILSKNIPDVEFYCSEAYTNPVRYSDPKYTKMQIKNLVN